ncbi:MAG TPA: polysaccharide biosynthesis/export family protein, partial [Ramlibacter sp.]
MSHRLFALVLLLLAAPAVPAESADTYALRHGDRLQISVWKEDALNREARVLPDGSIGFPLVGRIMVVGLSTVDVERRIVDGLKRYMPDPVVSVVVTGTEGNHVYVLGKVLKPGPIALTGPDTTVLQVLSQAGGLDRFANADAIMVMRKLAKEARPQTLRVRYGDLLRGEALESNVVMR